MAVAEPGAEPGAALGPGKPQIEGLAGAGFHRGAADPATSAADHWLRQAAEAVTVALDTASQRRVRRGAGGGGAHAPAREDGPAGASWRGQVATGRGRGDSQRPDHGSRRSLWNCGWRSTRRLIEREEQLRLARLIGRPKSPARGVEADAWTPPSVELAPEAAWR